MQACSILVTASPMVASTVLWATLTQFLVQEACYNAGARAPFSLSFSPFQHQSSPNF